MLNCITVWPFIQDQSSFETDHRSSLAFLFDSSVDVASPDTVDVASPDTVDLTELADSADAVGHNVAAVDHNGTAFDESAAAVDESAAVTAVDHNGTASDDSDDVAEFAHSLDEFEEKQPDSNFVVVSMEEMDDQVQSITPLCIVWTHYHF